LTLTKQLLQSAKILDIPILDHLIIGNGDFRSIRQSCNLWEEFAQ
jgi:DNA repair protein RadC